MADRLTLDVLSSPPGGADGRRCIVSEMEQAAGGRQPEMQCDTVRPTRRQKPPIGSRGNRRRRTSTDAADIQQADEADVADVADACPVRRLPSRRHDRDTPNGAPAAATSVCPITSSAPARVGLRYRTRHTRPPATGEQPGRDGRDGRTGRAADRSPAASRPTWARVGYGAWPLSRHRTVTHAQLEMAADRHYTATNCDKWRQTPTNSDKDRQAAVGMRAGNAPEQCTFTRQYKKRASLGERPVDQVTKAWHSAGTRPEPAEVNQQRQRRGEELIGVLSCQILLLSAVSTQSTTTIPRARHTTSD